MDCHALASVGPRGGAPRGRTMKGVQVRPEDLRSWLVGALQRRGEVAKAEEVSRVDVTMPDIVARLKAMGGKEAWHEVVVTSSVKGIRVGGKGAGRPPVPAGTPRPKAAATREPLAAQAPVEAPMASCVLQGVAPRIARRVRRRLAAPDAGGLLPLRGVGPGCPELLAGAMERWLEGALSACACSSKPASASRPAASADSAAAGAGATGAGHASARHEELCVSVRHVARWLTVGAGVLPSPLRWPAGVRAECRADAERAELQTAGMRRAASQRSAQSVSSQLGAGGDL